MTKINLTSIVLMDIMAILFLGCANTSNTSIPFNPSNKAITFKNGKPYAVPYGSDYAFNGKRDLEIMKNIASWSKEYIGHGELGIKAKHGASIALKQCKLGSVRWVESSVLEKYRGDTLLIYLHSMAAFSTGKARCTSPLSQQEYNYYLNKQNQKMAMQMQLQKQAHQRKMQSSKELSDTVDNIAMQNTINNAVNSLNTQATSRRLLYGY